MNDYTIVGRLADKENELVHVRATTVEGARRAFRRMVRKGYAQPRGDVYIDYIFEGKVYDVSDA